MYAARTGLLVDLCKRDTRSEDCSKTHSSEVPGTKTVELLGFGRAVPMALSSDALRSFSNFVCCANLRSFQHTDEHARERREIRTVLRRGGYARGRGKDTYIAL